MEDATRDSFGDEARQLRAIEWAAGASSTKVIETEKRNIDGAVIIERGTT